MPANRPPSLATLIDKAYKATEARKQAEKYETQAYAALDASFPSTLPDSPAMPASALRDTFGSLGGRLAVLRYRATDAATVTDAAAFARYARRTGNESVAQALRPSLPACRERQQQGAPVPGVTLSTVYKREIKAL